MMISAESLTGSIISINIIWDYIETVGRIDLCCGNINVTGQQIISTGNVSWPSSVLKASNDAARMHVLGFWFWPGAYCSLA